MDQPITANVSAFIADEETLLRRSYDQLQNALSVGSIATWHWDIGNDRVFGDQNLFRLFALPETNLATGLPLSVFTDNIHPDDRERVQKLIQEAIQTGHTYETEYRILPAENQQRWVLVRGQLLYNKQQKPTTFAGVLIDLTERKQAELRSQVAEDRLRLAIEAAQLGTWDFNPITQELIWSDRCKELFGLPPSAPITYEIFLEGVHPDDRAKTDQAVQQSLQPNGTGRYDIEYRTIGLTDKKLRWVRANGQSFFNSEGIAIQFIGTVIDITNSKRNEATLHQQVIEQTRSLEEQAHQLRTVLDASLNSIIAMTAIRDEAGHIVDFMMNTANEAVIKSNFMTPEQIIGRTLLTVFPGNRDNGFFDLYARVIASGKPEQSCQYYRDEFGLEGWFEISAVRQGTDGVVVTYNNITERMQTERAAQQQAIELREANAELKRSNESLQQFAHIASHDLQEPLRRIQAFSDILQNQFVDNISEGEVDMVSRIQRSAYRMQMLIKDLLTYSQLSTQRDPFVRVRLTDVVDDVLSDLEMTISEQNALVDVGTLPTILGSASRLRQLFQNLIANSLKFKSPDEQPHIRINAHKAQPTELPTPLQHKQTEPFWVITVSDNGIGFDERYKDRIFTPFQRLHNQATYGGTGIGLAISLRVAESHGGAIDVSSQPGQGSTFSVFLPASGTP